MKRATHIRVLLIHSAPLVDPGLVAALTEIHGVFEVTEAQSVADALPVLRERRFELVLVGLDPSDNPELNQLAALTAAAPEVAVMALIQSADQQLSVQALSRGAQECLQVHTPEVEPARLRRSIRNAIVRSIGESGRPLPTVIEQRPELFAPAPSSDSLAVAMFDESLIGMAILDTERRLSRVNKAFSTILGRSPDELSGNTLEDFTHPDFRGTDARASEPQAGQDDGRHVRETCFLHADGHTIWAQLAACPIAASPGEPRCLLVQVQDITERRAHFEHLRHIADHDPLTELLNRRGFDRELRSHLGRAKRYGATGALLLLDLDNFKAHNDTFGHDAGDELLKALADALRARLRSSDVVGRLGGDEFAVLLPDANRARTELVTLALLDQIAALAAQLPSAPGAEITASIGMVCFERTGALPLPIVKRYADEAMYDAKRRGRNQHAEWTPVYPTRLTDLQPWPGTDQALI